MAARTTGPLPISVRRTAVVTSPTYSSSSGASPIMLPPQPMLSEPRRQRWADATPDATSRTENSSGKLFYNSGDFGSGPILDRSFSGGSGPILDRSYSGRMNSGRLQGLARMNSGGSPSSVFCATPTPWASSTKYSFGPLSSTAATTTAAGTSVALQPQAVAAAPAQTQPAAAPALAQPTLAQVPMHTAAGGYAYTTQQQPQQQQQQQVVWVPVPMGAFTMGGVAAQAPPSMAVSMMTGQGASAGSAQPKEPDTARRSTPEFEGSAAVHAAGRQVISEALCEATYNPMAMPTHGGMMPSLGSAAHGTGKCKACAWFWKPQGCQNALNCQYCHLCPQGELKSRKKAKVNAIRMGVLEPSNPAHGAMGNVATHPGALKLTALLGVQSPAGDQHIQQLA